ncbi:unnamed protein product [Calicophoron daubneyi]|uniref:FERM domain-containing protein n=1 Tax=Calicophoron daubneyi TaxID=300641 RepID=A0AAV2TBK6_CALDB
MKSIKKLVNKDKAKDETGNKISRKPTSKNITCKIRLLDDTQAPLEYSVSKSDIGRKVFAYVCGAIGDIVEYDYFGLRYTDKHDQRQWLDLDRSVYKQMKGCKSYGLSFRVKHYPPDPVNDVKQNITRYLLYLQIRRDLAQGRLLCPSPLVGRIGALVAQAEFGDAPSSEQQDENTTDASSSPVGVATENPELDASAQSSKNNQTSAGKVEAQNKEIQTPTFKTNYLKEFKILISQTPKMEAEIMGEHAKLRGLSAQEAESELLTQASKLTTYGIDPFPVLPLHKIYMPRSSSSNGLGANESGDQTKTDPLQAVETREAVELPKGTAFYMGITGTGLATFVGLKKNQEYHWDQIQRLGCDGRLFLLYLKKPQSSSEPLCTHSRFKVHRPVLRRHSIGPILRMAYREHSLHAADLHDCPVNSKNTLLTYQCESKAAALALWCWTVDRKCFFTLKQASEAKILRPSSSIFHRTHTYRFSGRSQKELTSADIRDPGKEFVRVSSLRRVTSPHSTGDSNSLLGHATLPSRLRPRLDIRGGLESGETFEPPKEHVPLVIVPETVAEHPAEDDHQTNEKERTEDPKPESTEAEADLKPEFENIDVAQEAPIQPAQLPVQLTAPLTVAEVHEPKKAILIPNHVDQNHAEVRKRVEVNVLQSAAYQQVVSDLDRMINKHIDVNKSEMSKPGSTVVEKTAVQNGEVLKAAPEKAVLNGQPKTKPKTQNMEEISKKRTLPNGSVESAKNPEEKLSLMTTKTVTITAMTLATVAGLIMLMETKPSENGGLYHIVRESLLISTFESYVYSPMRNAIVGILSTFWS